ncbi:MAG TPA: sigma 54-interacting transcriptional regulator [Planctomycetota bacterium]|nr:sigma 54-interacting transcriptional regulator [Planctomycetota bacterium]
MKFYLTVSLKGASRTFGLARTSVVLGRAAECELKVDDIAISRNHCRFERIGGDVFVEDLRSRNGTILGDRPIDRALLKRGDLVKAGNTIVRFDGCDGDRTLKSWALKTIPLFRMRRSRPDDRRDMAEENLRLRQLLSLFRTLVEESAPDALLERIIDLAVELVTAERGFLMVFEGDDLSIEVARNYWRADISEPEYEVSRSIADRVRNERAGLLVEDAGQDPRLQEFLSVHALKLRSVLCVPLLSGGSVVGVLYLDNRYTRGSFRESDLELLQSFADLAAITLKNCGRFEQTRQKVLVLSEEVQRRGEELLRMRQLLDAKVSAQTLRHSYGGLVAESEAMRKLLREVDRLTDTKIPLMLEGPTGVGKESLARLIHRNGMQAGAPFVAIACAALPASLAEVELFGHAEGAFTGASSARGGILAEADGGTLYLDGIEDLDPDVQGIFLRFLETGLYRPVGDFRERAADIRTVASTRLPVSVLMERGIVRSDLIFRLRGALLSVPSLAERPEDLRQLLAQLIEREAPHLRLSPRARRALLGRPWPGNLLELRNEVRRLGTLGQSPIDIGDLSVGEGPEPRSLKEAVTDLERRLIVAALWSSEGNLSQAARKLGLSRLGLRNKLQRYGLQSSSD